MGGESKLTESVVPGVGNAIALVVPAKRCKASREPGPILRSLSGGHGVWVPAFAGTTARVDAAVPDTTWSLHPQLAADTVAVGDLALARVLLANDANYPWLILVPRRPGLIELIDLEQNEQVQLMAEIDATARVLKSVTECEKLNIAAIGNIVAQLHVHVVARRHSDAAWPKPVWGATPPIAYNPAVRDGLIGALRRGLQLKTVRD